MEMIYINQKEKLELVNKMLDAGFTKEQMSKILVDLGVTTSETTDKPTGKVKEKKNPAVTKPTPHTYSQIPELLGEMSIEDLKTRFGILTGNNKDTPYRCLGITKFFDEFGIESRAKYLSYAHKHLIIEQQLSELPKKTFNKIKDNCISFLQNKLENIPETNRFGKKMTLSQQEKIKEGLTNEINRWATPSKEK